MPTHPGLRRIGAVTAGTALLLGSALVAAAPASAEPTATRYAGADRYATAAASFRAATNNVDVTTAVLAGGGDFPDALSANYLAGQLGTGTLLTRANTLSPAAADAIGDANVDIVYVVGGTVAVSNAVVNQLNGSTTDDGTAVSVVRVGGANRYETNAEVNEVARSVSGATAATRALVASGEGFADALALGPVAYATNNPLVLTPGASLGTQARAQLEQLRTPVLLAGSSDVVSATTVNQIRTATGQDVVRRGGADRSATAVSVAQYVTTTAPYNTSFVDEFKVGLTNGLGFPDAVGAGPVVGQQGAVLLLTRNATNLGAAADYAASVRSADAQVFAFGGTDVLPQSTVDAVLRAMTPPATPGN